MSKPVGPNRAATLRSFGEAAKLLSAPHRLHDPAFVALPVSIFFIGALVVLLLALGKADLKLGSPRLPVQFQRHDGVAATLNGADQMIELPAIQQQLAGPRWVRIDMRG